MYNPEDSKPVVTIAAIQSMMRFNPLANSAVFSVLRTLKARNPGDTYLEAYQGHWAKRPNSFVDYYHLLWQIGATLPPFENVMEIGCRTGISISQLMAAQSHPEKIKVHLFDLFNDGFISPRLVQSNLKAMGIPIENVTFTTGDSKVTVPLFAKEAHDTMDYVLVDGDHSREGAIQDLENVVPLLKRGGILFFDDIAEDGCGLVDVWQDFQDKHEVFLCAQNLDGKGIGVGVKL
jgi:hypothetical protein